jgi:proliferating cell nuclear antigen
MTLSATVQAGVLTSTLAPVDTLVNECKLRTDSDGLSISAVDPANVGMVDVELDASAAAAWTADEHVLGINLDRLLEVLSLADSEEMVRLDLDAETHKLTVESAGLEVTMALIDPDSIRQEPDLPDLELPATAVVEGRDIGRAVTAADMVSDHIKIGAGSEGWLAFEADGDTDDVELTLTEADGLLSFVYDGDEPKMSVASLFSLEYLDNMSSAMPADCEVSVLLGDEFPAKLRYSLVDGACDVVQMLAPRIQNN